MHYDLHTHSYYSDGELSPEGLLLHAKEKAVDVIALTDHDTTAGVSLAESAANEQGIRLIPGVEISALWQGKTIHILAYQIDINSEVLQQGLQKHCGLREHRAKKIGEKLADLGIEGAYEGARDLTVNGLITRPHFAKWLLQQEKVSSMQQAFRRYLAKNKPAFVSLTWASMDEVIQWIEAAGGQAVVAHPMRYKLTRQWVSRLIREFKAAGGSGIEVISGRQASAETDWLAEQCQQQRLLASVGSDFHGPSSWANLGVQAELPANCQPIWSDW